MKIINKVEFKKLIEEYPNGGIVFVEYTPDVIKDLGVTFGSFGATAVVPVDGEVFCWDWNINKYADDVLFAIFDHNDILQMIQTLTSGLKINLEYDNNYFLKS